MFVERGSVYRKLGDPKHGGGSRVRVALVFKSRDDKKEFVRAAHLEWPGGTTDIPKHDFVSQYIREDQNPTVNDLVAAIPDKKPKRKRREKAVWNQETGQHELVRE